MEQVARSRPIRRRAAGGAVAAGLALATALVPAGGVQAQTSALATEPAPPCTARVPVAPFDDRALVPAAHAPAVDCLALYGITLGAAAGGGLAFDPAGGVSRGAIASFVARTVRASGEVLPDPVDPFLDIAGNVHAPAIRQLATAAIVQGREPGLYAPEQAVSRAQAASILLRAAAYARDVPVSTLERPGSPFTDTNGSVHEPAIAGAHELGLVRGVTGTRYEPDRGISRAQMASVLARWLASEAPRSASCTAPSAGYSLHHPAAWQVNDGSIVEACSVFDPEGVDVPPASELPLSHAVIVASQPVAFGQAADPGIGAEVEDQLALTVDGRQAVRQELVATGEGLLEEGTRYTHYLVDRGATTLSLSTYDVPGNDYEASQGVLTRMTLSLDLTGTGLPPFLPETTIAAQEGEGLLTLVDVRVANRGDYDRLVLEFAGEGQVGWRIAEWRDDPAFQGSGNPVDIAGGTALSLAVSQQLLPPDSPFPRYDGPDRIPGPGTPLREVVIGGEFEGLLDAFAGADEREPYRVFRLGGPERLVVDVLDS